MGKRWLVRLICRRTSKLRQRRLDAAQWFWVGSDPRFRSAPHSFHNRVTHGAVSPRLEKLDREPHGKA